MAANATTVQIGMSEVVNDVVVYGYDKSEYAQYLADYAKYEDALVQYMLDNAGVPEDEIEEEPPTPPAVDLPLYGLNIIDIHVTEDSKLTSSPIETGVEVSDFKVRQPIVITIKGICDNLRGGQQTTKDTRYGAKGQPSESFAEKMNYIPIVGSGINNIVGGVANAVGGYEFEQTETILTRARRVYESIHKMLRETKTVEATGNPKTYMIGTKGMMYSNMVLENVEQLNDAEHLMVIPVTLKFKELIIVGTDEDDNTIPRNDQEGPMTMSGYIKKNSWAEGGFGEALSDVRGFVMPGVL